MLQNCKFFTVDTIVDKWDRPISVYIDMNEDFNYEDIGKELAKNGIFYDECKAAAPASIFFEDAPENCVVIGTEDDGTIYFSSGNMIHVVWIPSFISVLAKVFDFVTK